MNTIAKGITKAKLTKYYPKLAKIVDNVYDINKEEHYWFFVNYCGKYKDKQGKPRTVSMGAIIDVISKNGYDIDIVAKKRII
jgi:hypothetical protein